MSLHNWYLNILCNIYSAKKNNYKILYAYKLLFKSKEKDFSRGSVALQCRGMDLIPDWGTSVSHATECNQNKSRNLKKKKRVKKKIMTSSNQKKKKEVPRLSPTNHVNRILKDIYRKKSIKEEEMENGKHGCERNWQSMKGCLFLRLSVSMLTMSAVFSQFPQLIRAWAAG